jgi:hypothetical protein
LTVRAFFLVGKVVDLLVEDVVHPGTGDHPAAALYSEGRRSLDPEQWNAFLEASNNLMRSKDREDVETSVDSFLQAVDGLAGSVGKADGVLEPGTAFAGPPAGGSFPSAAFRQPGDTFGAGSPDAGYRPGRRLLGRGLEAGRHCSRSTEHVAERAHYQLIAMASKPCCDDRSWSRLSSSPGAASGTPTRCSS